MNYTKNCPKCKRKIKYSSKIALCNSIRGNNKCKSCVASGPNNGMFGRCGKLNPFYKKSHTEATKKKISQANTGRRKSKKVKEFLSRRILGNKNPMYGKSYYDVWLKKYGQEAADKRYKQHCQNKKGKTAGRKNGMFGKPSPHGSGAGINGWYKGWFFRSLGELLFMLEHIERNNLKWVSGESAKFAISYVNEGGRLATYFPDFIIENRIYEIKPKPLQHIKNNILKFKAATQYCNKLGLNFLVVDPGKFPKELFKRLYKEHQIKLTPISKKRLKIR